MPYVRDTWSSVIIELSISFQPPAASLCPLLKVQVWRISISAYLAIMQDIRNECFEYGAWTATSCGIPDKRQLIRGAPNPALQLTSGRDAAFLG